MTTAIEPSAVSAEQRRGELLAHYADAGVRHYTQYDASSASADADAVDAVFSTTTYELRKTDYPVRVQILDGTLIEDAVRLLRKIADWIDLSADKRFDLLAEAPDEDEAP